MIQLSERAADPPIPHNPPRTILALDLGKFTGWAVRKHTGEIQFGTEVFARGRFEGGGMRFLRFTHWLDEIHLLTGHIDAVYFEEVRSHRGVDAAHAYGGYMAHLTAWCEANRIPYSGEPVGSIKKHATGKGNASKTDVTDAIRTRGYFPGNDNEADALALLDLVLSRSHP